MESLWSMGRKRRGIREDGNEMSGFDENEEAK